MDTLVLALPASGRIAAELAMALDCPAAELALHRFPDGEALVRIDAPVDGREVLLVASLDDPDAKTLPLVFAADAARELGAVRVGLVAPYLAYMRQDQRFRPGEAITSRSYARLLSRAVDFLVTVDPHLHRWRRLEEIYPIPSLAVSAAPAIADWVRAHVKRPLIVGPDAESSQWASRLAGLVGAPWAVLDKTRRGDRDVSVRLPAGEAPPDCTPVLVDDIVSTGHTLVAAALALQDRGLPAPVCVAVHALLAEGAADHIAAAGIDRFVSCDCILHASNAIHVAPLLAAAVRQVLQPRPPA